MYKLRFAALSLLVSTFLIAQDGIDFNNYHMLKCKGTIPEDFRTLSQVKYSNDVHNEARNSGHVVSSAKQDFLLETNYIIDELLLSGKVLFGDTVTDYINEVADKVLVNDPDVRSKLRFYCLRSSEANAFSTNQGIVFITLGLIAQLENEAQLAFVISHEVAHFEKKHTMNEYLEQRRIFGNASGSKYNYGSYDDRIRAASSYSKEMELQADSLGLIRLSKTGYSCDEAIGTMFVLQFSELPFEDYDFDPSFLETPIMKLPDNFQLDSVRPVDLDKDMDNDDYSSHPNIAKRRDALETLLGKLSDCGTALYATDKNTFTVMRKICRFETVHILLNVRDYDAAFYDAYILQKEDSNSLFLRTSIGQALYGLAKYKNDGSYSDVAPYYGKMEGNQQNVYYLFGKLSKPELNMVALRYLYDLYARDSSEYVLLLRNDLAREAVEINDITFAEMKSGYKIFLDVQARQSDTLQSDTVKHVAANTDESDNSGGTGYVSKYDKLRKQKKQHDEQQIVTTTHTEASKFYLLAFADILDRKDVADLFDSASALATRRKDAVANENARVSHMSNYDYRREQQQQKNAQKKHGFQLGIDTVVYVDPFYYMADDRHGTKLIQSETQRLQFCQQILENAQYSGLAVDLLNPKNFGPDDVDKYNDLATMNDWISERVEHDERLEFVPVESSEVAPLVSKYHTDHFCYTGIYTYKQKRDDRGYVLFLTVICYPLLPFGIAYALTPEYHTYYYTLLYDVNDGQREVSNMTELKSKSKKGYINSVMYDMMAQIHNKPKIVK